MQMLSRGSAARMNVAKVLLRAISRLGLLLPIVALYLRTLRHD
jgi:hypothetical protein